MTCLIVDDNAMARAALRGMVEDIDFLDFAGECADALCALDFLRARPVDLLLLDIEMPKLSGLELIESLPEKPLVILVTGKRDYAVEAFGLEVVDYLVKPLNFSRFLQAAQRARERHEAKRMSQASPGANPGFLFVKTHNGLEKVNLDDILYLQAMGDYVNIITAEKKFPIHITMSSIMERLPAGRFLRTHRSYIVAIDKIERIEDGALIIGREAIPVSESFRSELFDRLNLL